MAKDVFKPYKRKLNSWNYNEEKSRVEEGSDRYIISVQIGERWGVDEDTGEKEKIEELEEEIYLDTLQGIFLNHQGYEVTTTLGYEPQIVISYNGRLVMHNDKIPEYEDKIMTVLQKTKIAPIIQALVDYEINENCGEKYSNLLRRVQKAINDACKSNFPPEFIAYIIKDYVCDIKRNLTEEQMELSCMSYDELLKLTGEIAVSKHQGKQHPSEENLCEELFYRFLQGTLIFSNPRF